MNRTTRHQRLPVLVMPVLLFLFSCTTGSKTVQWTKGWCLFSSGPAYACYGAIGIILLLVLAFRLKKKGRKQHRDRSKTTQPESSIPITGASSMERELEQKLLLQEDKNRWLEAENESLKRLLAEAGQFARSGAPKPAQPVAPEAVLTKSLYFLQPAGNCFLSEGRVETIAEAVYELVYHNNKAEEALFTFVDTPDNTRFALQHEATWIQVACDRSNMPGAQTRSIRTDKPGIALLRDGNWVIRQKAKITYV